MCETVASRFSNKMVLQNGYHDSGRALRHRVTLATVLVHGVGDKGAYTSRPQHESLTMVHMNICSRAVCSHSVTGRAPCAATIRIVTATPCLHYVRVTWTSIFINRAQPEHLAFLLRDRRLGVVAEFLQFDVTLVAIGGLLVAAAPIVARIRYRSTREATNRCKSPQLAKLVATAAYELDGVDVSISLRFCVGPDTALEISTMFGELECVDADRTLQNDALLHARRLLGAHARAFRDADASGLQPFLCASNPRKDSKGFAVSTHLLSEALALPTRTNSRLLFGVRCSAHERGCTLLCGELMLGLTLLLAQPNLWPSAPASDLLPSWRSAVRRRTAVQLECKSKC